MTDAAEGGASVGDWSPERSAAGGHNPYLIAFVVSIATFMEVLDTTIANVALRYISGGLAVSGDEASWVITTYLVANSIVLCASGWIAEMFGRRTGRHLAQDRARTLRRRRRSFHLRKREPPVGLR